MRGWRVPYANVSSFFSTFCQNERFSLWVSMRSHKKAVLYSTIDDFACLKIFMKIDEFHRGTWCAATRQSWIVYENERFSRESLSRSHQKKRFHFGK